MILVIIPGTSKPVLTIACEALRSLNRLLSTHFSLSCTSVGRIKVIYCIRLVLCVPFKENYVKVQSTELNKYLQVRVMKRRKKTVF